MAQDESGIPVGKNNQRRSADLLPRYFRTVANKKFLSSTLDQMVQPGAIEKVDGFVGRKDAKAFKTTDNYVSEISRDRDEYQLEPVAVVDDNLGNTNFYRDYRDYYNALKIRGVDISDHNRFNSQEYYAWNPNINWDKFVNFREYYWLPGGPDAIPVYGSFRNVKSTFKVTKQVNVDNDAYVFNQENPTGNPTLTLYKGQTYKFEVDTVDMPFSIRTSVDLTNDDNLYNKGITGQKVENGVLTWEIDLESPGILYYVNGNDIEASGLIIIKDIIDNTFLDVDADIIGKKDYTMTNGKPLSNGMKLKFYGNINPSKYQDGYWYVEGVGESIKLISEADLQVSAGYLQDVDIEFDNAGFDDLPFDDAVSYANTKDYIVINRGSNDRNQWSRYNKWTHKEVIVATAEINGLVPDLDQNYRATRPIIEFDAGIKLFDFGTFAKQSVDLVDTVTKDVFSNIEGATGYFIDGTELVKGMRVLFTADPDSFVAGKIYEVDVISHNSRSQITLKETADTTPLENETVLVKAGTLYKGTIFYYNGTTWKQGQNKTSVNQAPLFDLFNDANIALNTLEGSTFKGNKVFSYKQGTGINDKELGFPLSYRTIENSGDITFDFNLLSDTYQYDVLADVVVASTDTALLRKYTNRLDYTNVSGWTKAKAKSIQPVVEQFTTETRTNNFIIDVYEKSGDLNDLTIKVYVDNVRQYGTYEIDRINSYAYVRFLKDLSNDQKVVIETTSSAPKNSKGFYKFPINFEKNPMNENVTSFTQGEVLDHVSSIVDNIDTFEGVFPGVGNLRDIGNVSPFGLRFVQHSGPINLALFNLTNKQYDMNEAVADAGIEYIRFKREFLKVANELGFEGEDKQHVDKVLSKVFETSVKSDAYYFSDMVPFGGDTLMDFTIEDASQTIFPITRAVDFTQLNANAILVYLDDKQLLKDKEYTINTEGFVELKIAVKANQNLKIYEYESTDGCWIPPTPTKLGLYPKFEPQIILDDTYISTIPDSTGPYKVYGRDETTTKSYKGKTGWFYPLFTDEVSAQAYDKSKGGTGLAHTHIFAGDNRIFYMPSSLMSHATVDDREITEWPGSRPVIQGHDGSIWKCFGDFRDNLILDLEKRIYNNLKMEYDESIIDIQDFLDTKANPTVYDRKRTADLMIPDFNAWLETVGNPDYVSNEYYQNANTFSYNFYRHSTPDNVSMSGGWRSIYKDFYNTDRPHSHPWEILGFKIKPDWFDSVYGEAPYTSNNLLLWEDMSNGIVRKPNTKVSYRNKFKNTEILSYIPVDQKGKLLSPVETGYARGGIASNYDDDFVFGDEAPVETAWRRSSHYPFSLVRAWMLSQPAQYFGLAFDRSRIARNGAGALVYKDTSKRINLGELQFPNLASDDSRVLTAGLVNYMQAYLKGNDSASFKTYKTHLTTLQNKLGHKIGGFTFKDKFRVILDSRNPKNEGNVFIPEENYKIVLTKSVPLEVYSYSGILIEKTSRGFIVKGYDNNNPNFKIYKVLKKQTDPVVNVGGISETFVTFAQGNRYEIGQIVEDNGNYFRTKIGHTSGSGINLDNFQKLAELPTEGGADAVFSRNFENTISEVKYGTVYSTIQEVVDLMLGYQKYLTSVGFTFDVFNQDLEEIENWNLSAKEFMFWSTQNWSEGAVLSISPSARQISFNKPFTVVDNIYDNYYPYSLLKADGKRLLADFATTERDNTTEFGIYVKNTDEGIYHLKVPVIQIEHAIVFDNKTVFNDVLYNRPQGYRQERLKIKGYRSDNWNGSFNVPGFIFDDATITEWTPWQDYSIGAIVKYKQYFYSAKFNLTGAEKFDSKGWVPLADKPQQELLPNLDYKARQFLDFYDLDSDNFDSEQQKLAQHLIGYQKRKYLENIINDDVAQYKFFQGMIQDKGTKNVLNKLFDKLGSANKESLEFYEEWAVRAGRYGATEGNDQFEVLLDESQFRLEPQPVELVDEINPQDTTLVYRLTRNNVFVKSKNYDHKPLPTKYFNDDNIFVKSAGYVNPNDVSLSLVSYDDILNETIGNLQGGQYVWTASGKEQITWAVYKYVPADVEIQSVTASQGNTFTVTLDKYADFAVGDILGINDIDSTTDGYYKVQSTSLNVITLEHDDETDIEENETTKGFITFFKNVRLSRLDDANTSIKGEGAKTFSIGSENLNTDTIWVDDDDTGRWLVAKYKQVYELKPNILNTTAGLLDSTEKDFGNSISTTDNNNTLAITAPKDLNGSVYVFQRPSDNVEFGLLQQIDDQAFYYDQNGGFGTDAALSPDGKWLAIGSPEASNVRSYYKGDYKATSAYNTGDIVLYNEQLWQADRNIESQAIQTFVNHASNAQAAENDYNTESSSYPEIIYMMRGNPNMPADATDHILIRAETQQWEGTKAGDVLTLKWNRYTTKALAGLSPFNNDAVLNETFLNGDHVIVNKVKMAVEVISALDIPNPGDEIVTETARANVAYRYVDAENKMIMYLNNVNGQLNTTGTITRNGVLVGEFTTVNHINDDYHTGWWQINVGSSFNTTNIIETNPNLVVTNITLAEEVGNIDRSNFANILDTSVLQSVSEPTRASYIAKLSHYDGSTSSAVVDSRWVARLPAGQSTAFTAGDKLRFWINSLYDNGVRQDPEPVLNLSYTYLNDTEHTVADVWSGYIEVRLTNADINGDPFLPNVGDTVTETSTGSQAEVAFIERDFATAKVYLKNRNGIWPKGGQYGEATDLTYIEQGSTVRTTGPINSSHFENSISGPLVVIDKQANIPAPTPTGANILQDLEYWVYKQYTIEGVEDQATPPGPINLDWNRTYNIPLATGGTGSGLDRQGAFAIYEKRGSQFQFKNYYTVANSMNGRRLGHKIKFIKTAADTYKLFVLAKGDGTETNEGRIYIFDKDANNDFVIASENKFRGFHNLTSTYFEGDIVRFGNTIYEAKTNLVPGPFDLAGWTSKDQGLDLLGYVPNDTNFSLTESTLEQKFLEEFGGDFDVSSDSNVLASTARYLNADDSSIPNRRVVVYRKNGNHYEYSQLLESEDITENFANTIAVSEDGKKIAVGAPNNSQETVRGGCVYIYIQQGTKFVKTQTLRPIDKTSNTRFGQKIDFDGNTLAITSKGGDLERVTTFDNNTTVFDNNNTEYKLIDNDSGLISLYETLNDSLLYSQDFTYDKDTQDFGSNMLVKKNHVYVGLPKQPVSINNDIDKGLVAEYRKPLTSKSWTIARSPVLPADTEKFKGVYLYNKTDNSLVTYLDYIDPLQGKIAGPAEQEISFKTSYDPAKYNVSTTSGIIADSLDYTTDKWIGKVWWDIDSGRFINHHQGDILESTANFNKLFPNTSVDVYEWVETTLKPSEWDAQSGTEEALTQGISGTSKYGDSTYSTRRRYDTASSTFTTYYYYWVKNKATLPEVASRVTTAKDVAGYITDPASQGYRFVAMLGNNRFSLYNCESFVKDKDIGISFNWWTISNQEQNTHNEYQLVTDGLEVSVPNREIERKWFDSLVGFDLNDRPVPDLDLPVRQRYGNLNDPRQGWFINRSEARKEFIERTNKTLKTKLIVDDKDLTDLVKVDPQPSLVTGKYDTTSDTYAELRFVSVARVKPATMTLEIENGSIVNVLVTDPGQGYLTPPTYTIKDSTGTGAILTFTLTSGGSIDTVTITNPGSNYTAPTIEIRRFSVLVKADETVGGKWAIFSYANEEWTRTLTQSYDTTAYWEYVDWYAAGYNQFTPLSFTIDASYQLYGLDDEIGNVIKIQNVGTGGWLLLEKIDTQDTEDYTINYKTIGRQNGTIRFKESLYNVKSANVAYDSASFDKIFYDTEPVEEMRVIIDTIKNKIFVDDLAIHWNELFFASIRYVFKEQPSVDWVFKTSFIKAKHNVGELDQRITFKNDSLASYEDYVQEVKPYRTKIREYLSSYEKIDPSSTVVTDFDLPPVYNELEGKITPQSIQVIDNQVVSGFSEVTKYPSKHWLDNVGFELESINIADQGSNYLEPPVLKITGGGGSGAEAVAYIGNGKISAVKVTKPGSGYLSQPTIIVEGTIADGGTIARLSPVLGGGKARSTHLRCKFDRVTGTFLFSTLDQTETFTTLPNQQIFNLKWPVQLVNTQITVTVDGLESLRSEYVFDNISDTSKGYSRTYGRITFTEPLAVGKTVVIKYNKSPDLLQAQDRINFYYNPTTGMLGNDLGQLLDGIDYGGVEVSSYSFGAGTGWDSDAWFTTTYDTFDTTFDDEIFQMDGSTEVFTLSKPLENNVVYNVYLNGTRIDDPNFGTANQTNTKAVMSSITGDGTSNTITIENTVQKFKADDVVVFRKTTSDGSFLPDPRSYDTVLSGGDLQFSTAKGLNPEEIIVDGDGFVTPTTSKGPEEQVPGQVLDTVNISVYHRPTSGGSVISSNCYNADGVTNSFGFGIQPQSENGLFVRLNKVIQNKNLFTVDYKNKTVSFNSIPTLGSEINVISVSGNGENIVEQDEFVGDGSTVQFVTKARWSTKLDYIATVDGVEVESVLISSEDSTEDPKAVIQFGAAPRDLSVITFAIYDKAQSFSKIETQEFTGDGSTVNFTLTNTPYSSIPASHNVIVKKGNKILNAGYNQQFDVKVNQREYYMEIWQTPIGSFDNSNVLATLNGRELQIATEYNIRPANSSIILEPGIGSDGDVLEIYIRDDGDYAFGSIQVVNNQNAWVATPGTLQLKTAPGLGEKIEVFTFSKHDIQDFERQNFDVVARTVLSVGTEDHIQYNHIKAGLVELRKPAIDAQFVWFIVNGELKTPSVDYKLTDDKKFVKYNNPLADNDVIEVIQFSSDGPVTPKFGFSQFKDILNRNIYKRLGDKAPLKLAKDLLITDKEISLIDASTISAPDKNSGIPGIIFINGERITYLIKQGNVLKQLQRSTLGTGAPDVHFAGSDVYNQGVQQTAPYVDKTLTEDFIGDGSTSVYELAFTPKTVNEFEVFVAGKRLRKNAISMFDPTLDQDSPEADVVSPAQFSVNGTDNLLTLTNIPADGAKIQVIRRQGQVWSDTGVALNDSESLVARFFKAEKVELPK